MKVRAEGTRAGVWNLEPRQHRRRPGRVALALATIVVLWTSNANAQGRSVGGHVGVALPLVSRSEGETTTMADDLAISVPVGVVFRKNTGLPIDIAVVPTLLSDGRVDISLGLNTVRGIGRGFSVGMGGIVDVSNPAWGLAAALDKVLFHMPGGTALVGDLIVPVLFNKNDDGARFTSVGVAMHVGVGF